ncbi:MAG: DUF5330 domain-containing protein [Rhizobiaceae bacterium]
MFFLMRMTFWFSLVLLALPFNPPEGSEGGDTVGPIQALFAARAAVGDLAGMCGRQPEVCETGSAAIHTIGYRAKAAYQLVDSALGDGADPDQTISTGSVTSDKTD